METLAENLLWCQCKFIKFLLLHGKTLTPNKGFSFVNWRKFLNRIQLSTPSEKQKSPGKIDKGYAYINIISILTVSLIYSYCFPSRIFERRLTPI